MYKEAATFLKHIARQKPIWKDGELGTAFVISVAFGFIMHQCPALIDGIKEQFSDILTVSSIVFGFLMTTLVFYVEMATGWSKDAKVRQVANKIVDWQVWSILCLLAQLAYAMALHAVDGRVNFGLNGRAIWFAILVFLTAYPGFQLINHTLIIWWTHRNVAKLERKPEPNLQGVGPEPITPEQRQRDIQPVAQESGVVH